MVYTLSTTYARPIYKLLLFGVWSIIVVFEVIKIFNWQKGITNYCLTTVYLTFFIQISRRFLRHDTDILSTLELSIKALISVDRVQNSNSSWKEGLKIVSGGGEQSTDIFSLLRSRALLKLRTESQRRKTFANFPSAFLLGISRIWKVFPSNTMPRRPTRRPLLQLLLRLLLY